MKILKPFLLLLTVVIFSSCGDFKDVTFSGIKNVKVKKMSRDGIEAEITARINNPNNVSFRVYRSDMDITLNGINCGKAHLDNTIRIKPKSEENYTFNVSSNLSSLSLSDLPKILSMAMSKNIKVGMKGDLKVGKLWMKRKYPVDISHSVPLDGMGL
jgi:LEA14-like dessication related protein